MPEGEDLTPEPETPQGPTASEWAQMKLDNAMLKAGVDVDSPHGKLIANAWSNREPDSDEIRKDWELVKPQIAQEEAPPERIDGEEGQAEERRMLASNTTFEPDVTDVEPKAESMRLAREVIQPSAPGGRAGTNEDAMATAFHHRAVAGGQGDQRVFVP